MKLFILCILVLTQQTQAQSKNTKTKDLIKENVTVTSKRLNLVEATRLNTFTIDKEDLSKNNIFHLENVWNFAPNLNTSGGTNRARYIQIRGIGERSEYDSVPQNSIGFYYDNIDLSGLSGVVATYNTERIEILQGPQSFLFGDASIGGNILLTSENHIDNTGSAWANYGSQKSLIIGAKANYFLTDNLSFNVGIQKKDSDGFYENVYLNKYTSGQDELFSNLSFYLEKQNFNIKTSHIFADQKNGYDFWAPLDRMLDDFETVSDKPGDDAQKTLGHSIEANFSLSKTEKIIFITSISDSDIIYSYDEDWGNNPYWNSIAGWNDNYDYNRSFSRKKQNWHNKLAYQKKFSKNTLTFGVHHYQRKDESDIRSFKDSNLRRELQSDYKSSHLALFSSWKHRLSKSFELNLSGRSETQKVTYNDTNAFSESTNNKLHSFSLSLQNKFNFGDLNFVFSRGFKGGGVNPDLNLSPVQQVYSPESMLNYELNFRTTDKFHDSEVILFYMDRNNQQITTSAQNNPTDPSDFTLFIDNAAKSENYGLELISTLLPHKPVSFKLSAGILKARFNEFSREGVSFDGRDLAHAPVYTFSMEARYQATKKLFLALSLQGKDEFYFSNGHNQKSSSYTLLNANIAYRASKRLKASVWGRNLLDRRYAARGFYFANEPPNWESRLYRQYGAPVEWGASLNWSFL